MPPEEAHKSSGDCLEPVLARPGHHIARPGSGLGLGRKWAESCPPNPPRLAAIRKVREPGPWRRADEWPDCGGRRPGEEFFARLEPSWPPDGSKAKSCLPRPRHWSP